VPEGDTIFRTARTLERALGGRVVTRFATVLPLLERVDQDTPLAGRTVESVESHGKWLEMRFSGGLILLTHMLMSGSWHIYRPGERWQRARYHMRIVIETAEMIAVAFNVPVAEFHTAASLARRRGFRDLGPDLLAPAFDREAARRNLEALPESDLAPALLNQSVLAGIGNVFKSEVCFVARVHPFRKVGSLTPAEIDRLLSAAQELLAANVTGDSSFRTTVPRARPFERLWVYGREGERCRACGAPIEIRRQKEEGRVTFWCPECQPLDRTARSRDDFVP
jgi:endonuclease VIII